MILELKFIAKLIPKPLQGSWDRKHLIISHKCVLQLIMFCCLLDVYFIYYAIKYNQSDVLVLTH